MDAILFMRNSALLGVCLIPLLGFSQVDVLTPTYKEHSLVANIELTTAETERGRRCYLSLRDDFSKERESLILKDKDEAEWAAVHLAEAIEMTKNGDEGSTGSIECVFGGFSIQVISKGIELWFYAEEVETIYDMGVCTVSDPNALLKTLQNTTIWMKGGIPDPFLVFGGHGNTSGKVLITKEEIISANRLALSVGEYDNQLDGGRLLLIGYNLIVLDNTGAIVDSFTNERCPELYDEVTGAKIPCGTRNAEFLTNSMTAALSKLGKGDGFRFQDIVFELPDGSVRSLPTVLEFEVR